MEIVKTKGHVINLFNSIKELTIARSIEFRKYLLQDLGIGNNISDVDDHFERQLIFASRGQTEDFMKETKNLRYNLFAMLSGIDYTSMSVACLCHSIDNRIFTSPDIAHKALIEIEVTGLEAELWLKTVKKNLILNANYTSQTSLETLESTLTESWNSL